MNSRCRSETRSRHKLAVCPVNVFRLANSHLHHHGCNMFCVGYSRAEIWAYHMAHMVATATSVETGVRQCASVCVRALEREATSICCSHGDTSPSSYLDPAYACCAVRQELAAITPNSQGAEAPIVASQASRMISCICCGRIWHKASVAEYG